MTVQSDREDIELQIIRSQDTVKSDSVELVDFERMD